MNTVKLVKARHAKPPVWRLSSLEDRWGYPFIMAECTALAFIFLGGLGVVQSDKNLDAKMYLACLVLSAFIGVLALLFAKLIKR